MAGTATCESPVERLQVGPGKPPNTNKLNQITEEGLQELLDQLPAGFDPSKPLKNARYEKIIELVLDGEAQGQAYYVTSSRPVSKPSASRGATNLFKRPEVRARMAYIVSKRKSLRKIATVDANIDLSSKKGVLQLYQKIARDPDAKPGEQLQAAEKASKLQALAQEEDADERRLDVAAVCAWIARCEMDESLPLQRIAEIRGADCIARALADLAQSIGKQVLVEFTVDGKRYSVDRRTEPKGSKKAESL